MKDYLIILMGHLFDRMQTKKGKDMLGRLKEHIFAYLQRLHKKACSAVDILYVRHFWYGHDRIKWNFQFFLVTTPSKFIFLV